jgi:hypothetical protein
LPNTGTVRTEQELLDIFADNVTQEISEQDMRDFVVSSFRQGDNIKISDTDTTNSFLGSKLEEGTGITLTVLNPGGDETIEIAASGAAFTDEKVKVSANDTTEGFLLDKFVGGTNVTLTENNDGGNETFTIDADSVTGNGTDNHIARWDGTDNIQDSDFVITDLGSVYGGYTSGDGSITASNYGTRAQGYARSQHATSNADIVSSGRFTSPILPRLDTMLIFDQLATALSLLEMWLLVEALEPPKFLSSMLEETATSRWATPKTADRLSPMVSAEVLRAEKLVTTGR